MKVLVISGFLGAGKTTFIKGLIENSGKYIAVLENEFGDINIDSQELSKSTDEKLQVLDFSDGCVCCSKNDSFLSSVLNVSSVIDPEYLVVEPSGVAELSRIMNGLEKIRYERIVPLQPIVIVNPNAFFLNMKKQGALMTDQIKHAGTVVYSKTESIPIELMVKVSISIKEINPNIRIVGSYSIKREKEWWAGNIFSSINEEENRQYKEDKGEVESPENVTISEIKMKNIVELIHFCEEILAGRYGDILRAKGTVACSGEILRFDIADSVYAITGGDEPLRAVFIGNRLEKEELFFKGNSRTGLINYKKIESRRINNMDLKK